LGKDGSARSWFCVINNPAEHGFTGTEQEIAEQLKEVWMEDNPQRTCAVAYCISADGLHHCHAVFEDVKKLRFSAIKKLFPGMHIEETKGNKAQAEDYIYKRGIFEEKGEAVVYVATYGEIKGFQGQRKDLSIIEELLDQGMTPADIMAQSLAYRRYSTMIAEDYFDRRNRQTPIMRDVRVTWLVGESGAGKSYAYYQLCEKCGENDVYLVSDYDHPFDKYNGERILFLDEFRGSSVKFAVLLRWLDKYKVQLSCRYANRYGLWDDVYIASVFPPELVYQRMVQENVSIDTYEQLRRRVHSIRFYYIQDGEYKMYEIPMCEYEDYETFKYYAQHQDTQPLITPDWVQTLDSDIEELSS